MMNCRRICRRGHTWA